MYKQVCLAVGLAAALVLVSVPLCAADSAGADAAGTADFSSFRDYDWGTSLDDIQEKELFSGRYYDFGEFDDGGSGATEDEIDIITNPKDHDVSEIFGTDLVVYILRDKSDENIGDFPVSQLSIMNGSVAGNNASINYIFADGILDAGMYGFVLESEFEEKELLRKYKDVYGDPLVLQDEFDLEGDEYSTPESAFAWGDSNGNVILLNIAHDREAPENFRSYVTSDDFVVYFNGAGKLWSALCSGDSGMSLIADMWNYDGI